LADDYKNPVRDSRLKIIIGQDHDLPVYSIEIDIVRQGPEAIEDKLKEFLSKGTKFLVACDAEFEYDLDLLVKGSMNLAAKILFSGSSGLAGVLAENYGGNNQSWMDDEFHLPFPTIPIAFFCCSYSSLLRKQLELLSHAHHGEVVELNPGHLVSGRTPTIPLITPGSPLILTLPEPGTKPGEQYLSREFKQKYGSLAADLMKNRQYHTIFASGGDLIRDILIAMDILEIRIWTEVCPGVVFSSAGPLSILTKSSDHGTPETLDNLYQELINEDDWHPKW
jgi:uncharacterized protein YgbK (DUF1537 family)